MEADRIQNSLARPQAVPWRAELRIQNAKGALRCSPGFWILDSGFSRGPRRRRGTVLVFVMAVLVLLALLGLGMMIAVRGERQKLTPQREALALEAVMDSAVRLVRERLRDDILRDPNRIRDPNVIVNPDLFDPNDVLGGDPNDPHSEGEPFDAPCYKDPWLASTIPWALSWDPNYGWDPNYALRKIAPAAGNVLVWPRVSYLGPDPNLVMRIMKRQGSPVWPPVRGDPPNILQPSALTNRLTVEGDPNFLLTVSSTVVKNAPNLFPLLLFDADGDGIPDSPISFTFPIDTPAPTDQPKRVHVAIRIVDNCSKLNVGTAGLNLLADSTFERRGRRIPEVVLDPNTVPNARVVRAVMDDPNWFRSFDPNAILGRRMSRLGLTAAQAIDPNIYNAVARGPLYAEPTTGIYPLSDEVKLTRRYVLVPPPGTEFSFVERSLPSLAPAFPRWRRFDSPLQYFDEFLYSFPGAPTGLFRRSLFTTKSSDVLRRGPLRYTTTSETLLYYGKDENPVTIGVGSANSLRLAIGYEKFDLNSANVETPTGAVIFLQSVANYLYAGRVVGGPTEVDRMRNAWQLALNILDYRDWDKVPTVLTTSAAKTTVALAGVEQQPFITEGLIKVIVGEDVSTVDEFYAVELYVPSGWSIDPNRLALNGISLVGGGGFGVTLPMTGAPSTGTFYVFANRQDPEPAVIPAGAKFCPTFKIPTGGIELTCDPDGISGPILPYPVDRATDTVFTTLPDLVANTTYVRVLQRNTTGWRWTVAIHKIQSEEGASPTYTASLGSVNANGPLDTEVDPCPWWFMNRPYSLDPNDPNHWAFDSPGDLSRVLAVGNLPTSTDPNYVTAPQHLALLQKQYRDNHPSDVDPNNRTGLGHLDFMRPDRNPSVPVDPNDPNGVPTNAFDYFTTIAAYADEINNDTIDPNADEPGEGIQINYRVAGRINVNTAPEYVLRSLPFFYDDHVLENPPYDPSKVVDLAAGIVTFREGRPVVTPTVLTLPCLTSLSPPIRERVEWFRTLGDLSRLRRNNPQMNSMLRGCLIDFHARDDGELLVRPDYDAATDPNWGAGLNNDVRERDILLARSANLLTVRSDSYTVYIALIDGEPKPDGTPRYLRRCQFTLDRVNCFRDPRELPVIFGRVDTNYYDDTR